MFECIYSGNPVPGIIKIPYITFHIFIFFYISKNEYINLNLTSLSLLINIDNF